MNKTTPRFVAALLVALSIGMASSASAQSTDLGSSAGLGIDLGLQGHRYLVGSSPGGLGGLAGSYYSSSALTNRLRVPIAIGEHWLVEPMLSGSFDRGRDTYLPQRNDADGENSGLQETTVRSRHLTIDLSLQIVRHWKIGPETRGFAGGRLGAGYSRHVSSPVGSGGGETEVTRRGRHLAVGPVLGAEHFLLPSLSLGLEAQLLGRLDRSERTGITEPSTGFHLAPGASLVLRTYF